MKPPYSYAPALPIAIGIAMGVWAHSYPWGTWVIIASCIAAIALWLTKRHYIAVVFAAIAIGWTTMSLHSTPDMPQAATKQSQRYVAVLSDISESNNAIVSTARILGTRIDNDSTHNRWYSTQHFKVRIYVSDMSFAPRQGDTIAFVARLDTLTNKADLPYMRDDRTALKRQGISGSAAIFNNSATIIGPCSGIQRWSNNTRDKIYNLIAQIPVNNDTRAFMMATILADRSLLAPETNNNMRLAGLAHVLALSGLHLGIIVWIIILILSPFKVITPRWLRYTIIFIAIWAFVLIVGMPQSVVRAATMFSIFILTRILQRESMPLNSLATTVIIILLFAPSWLFSPSFQLSVVAVFSLLIVMPLFIAPDSKPSLKRTLLEIIITPIAATLGTAALAAYYFGIFSYISLIPNIVVCLLLPPFITFEVIAIAMQAMGLGTATIANILNAIYALIADVSNAFGSGATGAIQGIDVPLVALALWMVGLIVLGCYTIWRRHVIAVSALSLWCTAIAITVFDNDSTQRSVGAEAFICRDKTHATLLLRDSTQVFLLTDKTAPREWAHAVAHKYNQYLLHVSGAQTLSPLPPKYHSKNAVRHDNYLTIGKKTLVFIDNDSSAVRDNIHVDYLYLTRGFKGSVARAVHTFHPDTVLIGADINRRRARRYGRECNDLGVPALVIGDAPKAFAIKNTP